MTHTPPRQQLQQRTYEHAQLRTAPTLLLRTDAHRHPLQAPYTGPYQVLQRRQDTVTIDVRGRPYVTSWERVKPAHVPPGKEHDPHPRQEQTRTMEQ